MSLINKKSIKNFFTNHKTSAAGLVLVVLVGVSIPIHFAHAESWFAWATGYEFPSTQQFVGGIISYVTDALLWAMSWITGIAGMLLNFVLKYTIVDMKTNMGGLTGINTAWKIIRDLMNIAFIFLLVFEGIKMIIGLSDTAKVKKFITGVILASLLINFSLFFTKVLIDASNIITTGIYYSMLPVNPDPLNVHYGLSDVLTSKLGVVSLFDKNTEPSKSASGTIGGLVVFAIGSTLVLLVAAFVFFAVACMFVIRYIVLVILLMLSPVAYMGLALPFMQPYAKQWWDSLKGQLLFAPIYMLMTLIVLTLIGTNGFVVNSAKWGQFLSSPSKPNDIGPMGLILNFTVIIGLLIASLVIAKSTSTQGSKLIGQATGKFTAFAGGAVLGGTAALGRQTVGRAGNAIVGSERMKNFSYKKDAEGNLERDKDGKLVAKTGVGGFASRFVSKTALKTGDKAAKSTFDSRSSGIFGTIAKQTGVDFGKGANAKDVNFQKDLEAKAKKEADYAKLLKPTEAAKDKLKEAAKELGEKENKAKAEQDKANNELDELNKKKKELEEKEKNATTLEEAQNIVGEIVEAEKNIKTKQADVDKLKTLSKGAEEARQKAEKTLNTLWEDRVDAYAKTFENEKGMRWFKNIAKVGGGVAAGTIGVGGAVASGVGGLGGATFITTKSDNAEIARKVRGVLTEKKKPKSVKEFRDNLEKAGFDVSGLPDEENKGEDTKKEEPEEKKEEPKTT